MNAIRYNLFPGGNSKAITLSYDDGSAHDRRLVEIFNRHGLKGTFHLNSSFLGHKGYLEAKEVRSLFQGHEVSVHTCTHPQLPTLPAEQMAWQILEDRRVLEAMVGYPVRGMSYPYGNYNRQVLERLPTLGMEYARTTKCNEAYHLPENFLEWHPTCHHNHDLLRHAAEFTSINPKGRLLVLYIWGHSVDFEREDKWKVIEDFGKQITESKDSVWFATNIDILDYVQTLQRLRLGVNGDIIQNLSHRKVWISVNDGVREIASGETVRLD